MMVKGRSRRRKKEKEAGGRRMLGYEKQEEEKRKEEEEEEGDGDVDVASKMPCNSGFLTFLFLSQFTGEIKRNEEQGRAFKKEVVVIM